jgi:phage terminase small subunit
MATKKKTKSVARKPPGLSPKQRRFCEEYLVDLNATQAAIRAGYSEKTANEQGARLLAKVMVSTAITKGRQKLSTRLEITQERVLREYARLAFLDIRKAFDKDGNFLPIHQLDDDTAAAIAGLEVESLYAGRGADRECVGRLHKIKLSDKKGALDSVAKHLGLLDRGILDQLEAMKKDLKSLEQNRDGIRPDEEGADGVQGKET